MLFAAQHTQASEGARSLTNRLIVKFATPVAEAGQREPAAEQMDRLEAQTGMRLTPLRAMSYNARVLALPERVPAAVANTIAAVSYTHLTLPTMSTTCSSRWGGGE